MGNKVKVGDILYDKTLKEYTVSKVLTKYFECERIRGKFVIETLKHYSSEYPQHGYQLFIDKQVILDQKEGTKLEHELRSQILPYGGTKFSLNQLRRISIIINESI
ncbi:MAG: hypothetical protein AABY22_11495 [Nanoarchaeota archaeon]